MLRKVQKDGIEYYIFDGISIMQNQMLKLLKIVDEICRENDIKYFIEAGTAVGQIRHGGFIPWDDDIDISMLKPDYVKLVKILQKMDRKKYFLFDYDMTQHGCTFFGERIEYFAGPDEVKRRLYPIKLDIRPLNIVENTPEALHENRVFREIANLLIYSKCSEEYAKEAKEVLSRRFNNSKEAFFRFYNYEYGMNNNYGSYRLVHPYMEYTSATTYEIDDVYPLREVDFCGMRTFVANTDAILKDAYKDYMQLPDIKARIPEACILYKVKNYRLLYPYLINKNKKSLIERVAFFVLTSVLVHKKAKETYEN